MSMLRTISLLIACAAASSLQAAELSKADLSSLFSKFPELDEEPQFHYTALSSEPADLPVEAHDERPAANDRTVRLLLRKLKRDPYSGGFTPEGTRISRRDTKALPLVLAELEGAKDYYRICLLDILSTIHDPRRDAVFVAQLESLLTEKQDYLTDDIAEPLMRTAGAQGIQDAVPILKKFLIAEDFDAETRAEARIALGRMGTLDPGSIPSVPCEKEAGLNTEGMGDHVALLELLLKYELIKAPLKLVEFEAGDGLTKVLKGTIEGGTWYLRVGQEQGGRVPFYYNWHTGPLSAAGYTGVAERKNGQWIVVYWRMIWIS